MNNLPDSNTELQQLLAELVEGSISDEQFQALQKILAGNPAAREQYREYVELHAMLQFEHQPQPAILSDAVGTDPMLIDPLLIDSLPSAPIVGNEFPGAARSWFGGWSSIGFLTLAIVVGIAAVEGWLLYRSNIDRHDDAKDKIVATVESQPMPAAYLTMVNGCNWGHARPDIWEVGHGVQLGEELTLHEGIAEFNLSSGVTLSIEGPAALLFNSPSSLVVHHGKVTAFVPWTVTDFKMLASTCPITACDASFGVNVSGSVVDLHVFSGEAVVGSSPFEIVGENEWEYGQENLPVQREEALPSGSEFIKARVPKGRALMLTGSDGRMKVSRWHGTKTAEFAAKLSMAGSLPVTASYVQAVIKSKPVGYWRFESQEEQRVVNQVSPSNDLLIVENVKLIGDEENRVAEFGRSRSEGHMVSSKPLDALAGKDYSAEFWLKPSHSHRGGLIGLAVNQHRESGQIGPTNIHGFFLEIVGALKPAALVELGLKEPNSIRFLHRDPPGSEYRMGTSCFSDTPYVVRRWQHVVSVKAGPEMRLYLNGKLTAKGNDSSSLAKGLYLEVGQLIGTHEIVPFVGQLDELSVYNRALTTAEIKRHYKAIDWTTKRGPGAADVEEKAGKDGV